MSRVDGRSCQVGNGRRDEGTVKAFELKPDGKEVIFSSLFDCLFVFKGKANTKAIVRSQSRRKSGVSLC